MRNTAAAFLLLIMSGAAGAETPLPAFNGAWTGSGQDRATPMRSLQDTRCKLEVKADTRTFSSETRCQGAAGLKKTFRMSGNFDGNRFTGDISQASRVDDGEVTVHRGKATGQRNGDVAEMTVVFPGLTPNAYVTLALTSPGSFSMKVRTLGSTLTDVDFRR
jgi:hypothetical protein